MCVEATTGCRDCTSDDILYWYVWVSDHLSLALLTFLVAVELRLLLAQSISSLVPPPRIQTLRAPTLGMLRFT